MPGAQARGWVPCVNIKAPKARLSTRPEGARAFTYEFIV